MLQFEQTWRDLVVENMITQCDVRRPNIRRIAITNGLEILCSPVEQRNQVPTAIPISVHLKTQNPRIGLGSADDGIMVIVTKSRLRTMLDKRRMPDAFRLLLDGNRDCLEVNPPASALLGRIADEICNAPYTGAARALFLQSKVLELLAEALALEYEANRDDVGISER